MFILRNPSIGASFSSYFTPGKVDPCVCRHLAQLLRDVRVLYWKPLIVEACDVLRRLFQLLVHAAGGQHFLPLRRKLGTQLVILALPRLP